MSDSIQDQPKRSWWRRLSDGLKRTSSSLGTAVADLVTKRKLDRAMLDDIEDVLLRADLGTEVAARIAAAVGEGRYDKAISADEVKSVVATEVEKVLSAVAKPLVIDGAQKPFVVLVVGVNGSGKTTTIGKLASKLRAEGRKVMLAAGDTFRAAAVEQLKIWGERTSAPVIARAQGADSAGPRLRCADRGESRRHRRAADRHRRPAAEQGRADERAREGRSRHEEGGRRRRRMQCCWCSMPPLARTPCRRSMPS